MPIRSHHRRDVIVVTDGRRRSPTKAAKAGWAADLANDLETGRERRRTSRMRYRLRRQVAPWYAATGLLAFVGLAWAAQAGPATAGIAAGIGLVITGFVAVFARAVVPPMWRRRVAAAGILGSLWTGLAVAAGPSWDAVLALTLLTVGLSLRWWRHHRIGYPTGPVLDDAVDQSIAGHWAKNVGNVGGPLPGSFLTDRTPTKAGEQYTVNLSPGKQTLSSTLPLIDKIGSGLYVELGKLVLEQHPSRLPTKLVLTVVRDSPVENTVAYPGPNVDDGIVRLGLYADGDGMAPWRLWSRGETDNSGSWWGGLVIGGIGSGKSRLIEELAISAMSTGYTILWFIDPQGGASSPSLRDHADWYTDTEDRGVDDMLAALERIAAARARENAAYGWVGFDPSPTRPGILVLIDEAHEVFSNDRHTIRWTQLARKCRKVGVGIVALSQYPGLTTFGGSEPLRAAVMGGNGVIMYADSNQNRQLMPGVVVDPLTLPKDLPGFGYTLESRGFGRTAPFRAFYVADPAPWMARYTQPDLDRLAAHAAGDLYTRRAELADRERAALLAEVDRMASHPTVAPDDTLRPPRFPTLPTTPTRPQTPAAPQLSGAQARIWDALGREERSFGDLVESTGWSKARTTTVLGQLVDAGHVVKPAHGRYRRQETPS